MRSTHIKFSDEDEGNIGLDWVPEDLLDCDCDCARAITTCTR